MTLLYYTFLAGIISGLLIALSIAPFSQVYLLLIAFIPSLYILNKLQSVKKSKQLLIWTLHVIILMTTWTTISFYWLIEISFASFTLGVISCIITFLLCTFPILLIPSTTYRFLAFILSVLLYEILVNRIELTSPFVTIGPWVAQYPLLTQYYMFTGLHGGTFWILTVNIALYHTCIYNQFELKKIAITFLLVITPPLISLSIYKIKKLKNYETSILVTNTQVKITDPKFTTDENALIEYFTNLTKPINKKEHIDLAIFPEGLSNHLGWIDNESNQPFIQKLNEWRTTNNISSLLIGGLMYKQVSSLTDQSGTEKKDGYFYTTHNVSVQLHNQGIYIQGKEEFVPFHEAIPYPSIASNIEFLIKNIGYKTKISKLTSSHPHLGKHRTLICYEALNPLKSKNLEENHFLVVVSSESWTKNRTAHQQFNDYLKAIALSQNTSIVKSSNFGTSIVLTNKGETKTALTNENSQLIKI